MSRKASGPGTSAKPRRSRGGPSITPRADGRWSLTCELPRGPDGRRRRHQSTHRTFAEARDAARQFNYSDALIRVERGQNPTLTVDDLLRGWLDRQPADEDSTRVNRAWLVNLIGVELGRDPVSKLRPERLQAALARIGETHAVSTVQKVRRVLRAALEDAVQSGTLARNPAASLRVPILPTRLPDEAWSQAEVQAILTAAKASRIYPFVLLALATGARIGELVAARLEDYDPETGRLTLDGTAKRGGGRGKAKTAAGHRVITLAPAVQAEMLRHLEDVASRRTLAGPLWGQRQETSEATRQKQREAARRQAASGLPEGWLPPPPPAVPYNPLIPTDNGTPWLRGNVGRHWKRVLESAGLPHRRLHSTRAAFITAALQDPDVSVADIQFAVGHATPTMTLRYAQRERGRQAAVAAAAVRKLGLEDALSAK